MKETGKAIEERSSTRGYTQQKLAKETLDTLIRAGLQAPTAANKQEIHITAADGSEPILQEIEAEKNRLREISDPASNFYYDAPTVLILSGDSDFVWSDVDAGIAVENIALAAEGLGLGSLIIGCIRDAMLGEKKEYFAEALKFPKGYEFKIAIALGYKAVSKEPHEIDLAKNVTCLSQDS